MIKGKLLQLAQAYADKVVREYMALNQIPDEETFRAQKNKHAIRARTQVIKRLHADGFSQPVICKLLRFDLKTVSFRFNLARKQRSRAERLAYYHRRKREKLQHFAEAAE